MGLVSDGFSLLVFAAKRTMMLWWDHEVAFGMIIDEAWENMEKNMAWRGILRRFGRDFSALEDIDGACLYCFDSKKDAFRQAWNIISILKAVHKQEP